MPRASTNRAGLAALRPDYFEQVLGDLAGDRPSPISRRCAELRGRQHTAMRPMASLLVQPPEQLVDHPFGRHISVRA